jgi:serine/threonine protein kinase
MSRATRALDLLQLPPLTPADEERLVRMLLDRGLVSAEELARCQELLRSQGAQQVGNRLNLLQALYQQGLLTSSQAQRAARELLERPAGVPRYLPGYELIEPIGKGSMGVVFKARQLSMDRVVAVKILRKELASNAKFIECFHREAKIAAKLSHNNIVQAIDSGEYKGLHYFVMEYVDGTNIKQELDKGKIYSEREALQLITPVAEALDHAYRRGLVHRDVKPENIMLTADGTPKLADLGLARLSEGDPMAQAERGLAVGTPYYISPEQIRGLSDIDIRADIYSLGATLYHMVTGRVPFSGATAVEVMRKHLYDALIPPDHINTNLSSGLGEVVEKMMAKDRQHRYQTPEELLLDLRRLAEGQSPLLARQKIDVAVLERLESEGEQLLPEEVHPRATARMAALESRLTTWKLVSLVLGLCLLCSVLLNVILFLR